MTEEATKIIGEVEPNSFTPEVETKDPDIQEPAKVEEPAKEPVKEAVKEAVADYELKLEDGDMLHANDVKRANAIAKELGLTEEQAQKLKGLVSESLTEYNKNLETKIQESNLAVVEQSKAANIEIIQKDPVMGGENFDKTLQAYDMAIKRYGDDRLSELLESTGAKYDPTVLKFIAAIGSELVNTASFKTEHVDTRTAKEISLAKMQEHVNNQRMGKR